MTEENKQSPLDSLIEYFGNISQSADALGVDRQVIQHWIKQGYIPWKRGELIEEKTNGVVTKRQVWEAAAAARHH